MDPIHRFNYFCHPCGKWVMPKDAEDDRCPKCSKLLWEVLAVEKRKDPRDIPVIPSPQSEPR